MVRFSAARGYPSTVKGQNIADGAAEARAFDAVGEFLVSLGNIQELAAHVGAAHSLGLPPDDLRTLQVLFRAGLKRAGIINHTSTLKGLRRSCTAPSEDCMVRFSAARGYPSTVKGQNIADGAAEARALIKVKGQSEALLYDPGNTHTRIAKCLFRKSR